LSAARPLAVGVDLGGTKIYTALSTPVGDVLADDRRPTEGELGPDGVIERIAASAKAVLATAGVAAADIAGVGLSSPGPLDNERGVVTDAANLPGWHNVPLAARISDALGVPALLENDADAAAWGEHLFGVAKGLQHVVLVTLGTGIGGGLVLDGRIYRGASGAAGEVGHMTVNPDGPPCGCGAGRGHLEALASGRAFERAAAAAIERGESELLARPAKDEGPSAKAVGLAAAQGDPVAQRMIEEAGHWLGVGLASLVNIFNPQAVVLRGGLMNLGERYLGPARRLAREGAFPQSARDAQVLDGTLGDRAGALGAAALMLSARER
jgi:glucokinase